MRLVCAAVTFKFSSALITMLRRALLSAPSALRLANRAAPLLVARAPIARSLVPACNNLIASRSFRASRAVFADEEIPIPELGAESIVEGGILSLNKGVGDYVAAEEMVAEIETGARQRDAAPAAALLFLVRLQS